MLLCNAKFVDIIFQPKKSQQLRPLAAQGLSLPNLLIPFLNVLPVSQVLLGPVTAMGYVLSNYLTTCTACYLGPFPKDYLRGSQASYYCISFMVRKDWVLLLHKHLATNHQEYHLCAIWKSFLSIIVSRLHFKWIMWSNSIPVQSAKDKLSTSKHHTPKHFTKSMYM